MSCCDDDKEHFEGEWYQHPLLKSVFFSLLIAILTVILSHKRLISRSIEISLFVAGIILGGHHWFKEAVERLFVKRRVSIDFLMMAATVGSAALGMWDEAAFLVILYGAAEGLEEYTFARTRASIRKLMDLAPKQARVIRDGAEVLISAEALKKDEEFVVIPGESIPTDGIILEGRSSIDEAPVTGESVPLEKGPGEKVFSATINHDGVLKIRATTDFANNTLSKMVHLIEEARDQKGRTQQFIEKFGAVYSPIVLIAAALLFFVPLLVGGDFAFWANRAVVLLVAAAPCALIMSTPVAIAAGIGTAGKNGVLIKGGMHLETLGKIRIVAFDKTGTLTKGKPKVTDIASLASETSNEVLELAFALERSSSHPLALAIIDEAKRLRINSPEVIEFKNLVGSGVQGKVKEEIFFLGSVKFFQEMGLNPEKHDVIRAFRSQGKTVVLVGKKDRILGLIAIQDSVREEAGEVIRQLHDMGIKTAMLTGDNELTARTIASALNIDDVRADLKPEDKIKSIESLAATYGPIAMIGDGINDAPALARANIGIAMGAAGTDAAIEASDAALMGDDLNKLIYALTLGKKAKSISQQNISFSILVLLVLVPTALLGIMTVAMAVAVHEVAELLAVANGLRVSRTKPI